MRLQRGLTVTGFIIWAVIFFVVALFGFKVGPAYVEYYTLVKHLKVVANEPEVINNPSRHAVEFAYQRRTTIEDVPSVRPSDLLIAKEGDRVVVSAEYTIRVPLVGNMSACMDFRATSEKN